MLQGRALQLTRCSDSSLTYSGKNENKTFQSIQAFHFLYDGRIRNQMTGLCIRRMLCGINPVYDLGDCGEDSTTTAWITTKAVANQMNEREFMGSPLVAVVKESCNMCGPYQLLQMCKGVPMKSNWGCADTEIKPGWTKLPVTRPREEDHWGKEGAGWLEGGGYSSLDYHEDEKFGGSDTVDGVEASFDGIDSVDMSQQDLSEYCGTFMTDGPSASSWFYFLRVGS
jgi:hypothetical protein